MSYIFITLSATKNFENKFCYAIIDIFYPAVVPIDGR